MYSIIENASLLDHNTFGIDAHARYLGEYDTVQDLTQVFADSRIANLPWLHIGQGSNLLFSRDWPGVVLHARSRGIRIVDEIGIPGEPQAQAIVEIEPGTPWDDVCAWAAHEGLYGIENLSGIPGETGAAVVQNIGAYGSEVADVVQAVAVLDVQAGEIRALDRRQMHYGYRQSMLKRADAKARFIVVKVYLSLWRSERWTLSYRGLREALARVTPRFDADASQPDSSYLTLSLVRDVVISLRNSKLPSPRELGNAGSFFKNPVISQSAYDALLAVYPTMPHFDNGQQTCKIPAAWLIEQCGWKGRSVGRAAVYDKQCLVLVNRGGATADEIIQLAVAIVDSVKQKFDITLEPEVNIL